MRGVWQLAFLTRGTRFETFTVRPAPDYAPAEVRFSHEGLESLRLGLAGAGLTSFATESYPWPAKGFENELDGRTPRRPYRVSAAEETRCYSVKMEVLSHPRW